MSRINQDGLKAASDPLLANQPVSLSVTDRKSLEHLTKIVRRKSRQRCSVEDLKLDLSSRILFFLLLGVVHLLSLLPDFVLLPLGSTIGYIGYQLDRRRRKIGMRNLAIAFPERDKEARRRILLASYRNLGRSGAEYVRLGGFFYRRLKGRVTYNDHLEYWNKVQERHSTKGVLVLTAHLGNFELLRPPMLCTVTR
jgi:lauroyl/myristoyl acyltransferase